MNELIAAIRAIVDAWSGGDLAGAVNNAREVADLHEKNESHAENTKMAYDVMQHLGVTLYDLELWGIIEGRDDVLGGPEQAFDALIEDGFNLGHSNYIEHYYQATSDYVYDALEERDLIKDDEDGAGWFPSMPGDQPNETVVPIGQSDDETPDDVLERAKSVERGEAPSGSVVMKLTGENSLHSPGDES